MFSFYPHIVLEEPECDSCSHKDLVIANMTKECAHLRKQIKAQELRETEHFFAASKREADLRKELTCTKW